MNAGARSLLVVGTGLVGTSVGMAARERGWQVWLQDLEETALDGAVSRGAGRPGWPSHDPDLVVIAVPPTSVAPVLVATSRRYTTSTLSDVSSVKSNLLDDIETDSIDLSQFVPGHPLAGSEVSGPQGARSDLFRDRAWVLTPSASTDQSRVAMVSSFAESLGAVVLTWDAVAHDRAVALTSHLPQLLSSALAARLVADGAADPRLSGQGLRDMTRIAASDPRLWTQILAANAAAVVDVLAPLTADLGRALQALQELAGRGPEATSAAAVVTDVLERGNRGRDRVPGKHGTAAGPTGTVVVAVPDRPGQLARLFAVAAEAEVNLEDVRIDHALGRPTGLVELVVGDDSTERLLAALAGDGWKVVAADEE